MNRFVRNRLQRIQDETRSTAAAKPSDVDRWSRFDKWFVRLSHIAQVGLFSVTVFGLYFTVIPLYQKAALEEQIAKRESELHAAELAIKRTYAGLRDYAVREFVFGAGAQCSGLMEPPKSLRPDLTEATAGESPKASWLTRDVRACLDHQLRQSRSLSELNAIDRSFMEARVRALAARLEGERPAVVKRLQLFPKQALADRTLLPPPGEFGAAAIDICHRLDDPTRCNQPKLELELRISEGQRRIEMDFADRVRSELLSLRSMDWQTNEVAPSH